MAPTTEENQCEVVLVGCGAPLRGMGWYHSKQMLLGECPSAKLCYVVEPWFMGGGKALDECLYVCNVCCNSTISHSCSFTGASGPGGPEFAEYQKETESEHGVEFLTSVAALPAVPEGRKRMALISGRTADNPRLMGEAIKVRRRRCCCCMLEQYSCCG